MTIFMLFFASPCFGDEVRSHVDAKGNVTYTNTGPTIQEQQQRDIARENKPQAVSTMPMSAMPDTSGIATAQNCYESSVVSPSPFMGNNGEIFKLADGSLWEVKYAYEYLYEYSPSVVICPSNGKLVIKGKTLNVEQAGGTRAAHPSDQAKPVPSTGIIESQIDGEFSGWDGETIFKLTNGQIWQQSSYAYTYSYKYRPKVLIFQASSGFELQVEGIDRRIKVVRIR